MGAGEGWVSLVHEGGGAGNAMETGGVQMPPLGFGKYETCIEARGACLSGLWTTEKMEKLMPAKLVFGEVRFSTGKTTPCCSNLGRRHGGDQLYEHTDILRKSLLRRGVDVSCRWRFDDSEVPRSNPMPINTQGGSTPLVAASVGARRRCPRETRARRCRIKYHEYGEVRWGTGDVESMARFRRWGSWR